VLRARELLTTLPPQHQAGPDHPQIASGDPLEAKPPHFSKVVYAPEFTS